MLCRVFGRHFEIKASVSLSLPTLCIARCLCNSKEIHSPTLLMRVECQQDFFEYVAAFFQPPIPLAWQGVSPSVSVIS